LKRANVPEGVFALFRLLELILNDYFSWINLIYYEFMRILAKWDKSSFCL